MIEIAKKSDEELKELFQATAYKMGVPETIAEKDFWVCFLLDHLFNDSSFNNTFVFKGGTSLSKAFHVIERFSEDIDLILDWTKLDYSADEPWEERSNNQQDKFNKRMNGAAAKFYEEKIVPALNAEIESKLGLKDCFKIDENDPMIVIFNYPVLFPDSKEYLRPYVQLEIGPIAEWLPSTQVEITPFAAEYYPHLFSKKSTLVRTIDVERTFWEKITILHKIKNWPDGKPVQKRYARHLYDVFQMAHSDVKDKAFAKKELLERDVLFKKKFYYAKTMPYDTLTLHDVQLVPEGRILEELRLDYDAMKNMIYGTKPAFDEIIECLKNLEKEIHQL